MAKEKKKKGKKSLPDLSNHDPLQPIDLSSIGSNGDPCFGKGYDLSTKECKLCGDSELCAYRMSQLLNKTRKELEEENKYKDLDVLEDVSGIKKYLRARKRKGDGSRECINKASEKFEVPIKLIRKIYKEVE